jgi:hypothetical protein
MYGAKITLSFCIKFLANYLYDLGISLQGISTTRNLLADDAMVPISSPLTPPLGDGEETDKRGAVVKRLKVQAIKKDIKQVTTLQD